MNTTKGSSSASGAAAGSNAIIKRIENAKNKELIVDDYKKQLKRMEEEYKMWIADHSKDLLNISSGVATLSKNMSQAADTFTKAEQLLESLQQHQQSTGVSGSRVSSPDKKQTAFTHLLKFSLGDLLSENPLLMSEIRASGTPNSQKLSLVKKFSERDSNLSGVTSNSGKAKGQGGLDVGGAASVVERLEVGLMDGSWNGVAAVLRELAVWEEERAGEFLEFEIYGRWVRAKETLVERAKEAVEFEDRELVLAKFEMLNEAGFAAMAEELYYCLLNKEIDEYRQSKVEQAKAGQEQITSEVEAVSVFKGLLEKFVEYIETIKTRLKFTSSKSPVGALFANWAVSQVNITLGDVVSCLSDDILGSASRFSVFCRRLSVEFGNFDIKGLSLGFLLEEFEKK